MSGGSITHGISHKAIGIIFSSKIKEGEKKERIYAAYN